MLDAKHHRIGAWLISLFVVGAEVLGMRSGGADMTLVLLNAVVLLLVVIGGCTLVLPLLNELTSCALVRVKGTVSAPPLTRLARQTPVAVHRR
ncbi:MAG: hypothetical protein ACUVTY_06710 [Armatimonadota bacterium]